MFGCALLGNGTTESYVWLLSTWLETMCGRTPTVIITNDDKAMAKAIADVLPRVTHLFCMWHILQKLPEHFAHVLGKSPTFQEDFHHCIHDTVTIEEFEKEWTQLICNYDLKENDWLKELYMHHEKWIPAYLQKVFCVGMWTTQSSESIDKFFKDFVHSSTLVSDFVYQYEKALDKSCQSEKEVDVKTRTTKAILKTCYNMEAEVAKVYTRKLFLLFQEELFLSQKHKASKYHEEGTMKAYMVMSSGKEDPVYHAVLDVSEKKAVCSCKMFEFVGILCRHVLAVFVKKYIVDNLPQKYVLRRWTIFAKDQASHDEKRFEVKQEDTQISSTLMGNNLMVEFLRVLEEGQNSKRKHDHLALSLRKLHSELLAMDDER